MQKTRDSCCASLKHQGKWFNQCSTGNVNSLGASQRQSKLAQGKSHASASYEFSTAADDSSCDSTKYSLSNAGFSCASSRWCSPSLLDELSSLLDSALRQDCSCQRDGRSLPRHVRQRLSSRMFGARQSSIRAACHSTYHEHVASS